MRHATVTRTQLDRYLRSLLLLLATFVAVAALAVVAYAAGLEIDPILVFAGTDDTLSLLFVGDLLPPGAGGY